MPVDLLQVGERRQRIRRVGREKHLQVGGRDRARHLRAQQLVAIVAAELERDQLAPDEAVGRPPGLRAKSQQREFRRQGAAMGCEVRVDPGGVGLERPVERRREVAGLGRG